MTLEKIEITNIFLMVISAFLAILLPFELFVASYVFLGPLHYSTEISWLHKKQYFIDRKKDANLFLTFCLFLTILITINIIFLFNHGFLSNIDLIFIIFAASIIFIFINDWWKRINFFAIALFVTFLFKNVSFYNIIFGVLLTTIIHVWIFNGIFILSGIKKHSAILSKISFFIFIFCSFIFLFVDKNDYVISTKILDVIKFSNLQINGAIFQFLQIPYEIKDLIYSKNGIKVQSFIAFAYTYHYLNWFSKVELIKWHQVSRQSLYYALIFWIFAIALYLIDYHLGWSVLLFFSMLHVFLEFPLNIRAISSIFSK